LHPAAGCSIVVSRRLQINPGKMNKELAQPPAQSLA
jgi:hypothetical protein